MDKKPQFIAVKTGKKKQAVTAASKQDKKTNQETPAALK